MTKKPPRVFLQQRTIAHYRKKLFSTLSRVPDCEFTIAADGEYESPVLKGLSVGELGDIRFRQVSFKNLKLPLIGQLFWQPRFLAHVWRDRPDVVIAEGSPYSLTAWVLGPVTRALNIPLLLWTHGLVENEQGVKWKIRRILYRLADGLLLYGDRAKEMLVGKGFPADRLHVVYNSLDVDEQRRVADALTPAECDGFRTSLGMKDGDRLAVFTGRLQPRKQLEMLVEAVARLSGDGKRMHVAFIGDGSARRDLATQAQKLGVGDQVHFLGARYEESFVGLVMSASDICVIPSAAGLTVMHALAYGTPVLLNDRPETNLPEMEAVKDGVTGFFFKYGNVENLADRLDHILFPESPKPRMSEACLEIIRTRYNPHTEAEAFAAAVGKHRRG